MAVSVVMFLAVVETLTVSICFFFFRHILGRAYSNEKQVVDYIGAMIPFICLSVVTDSLQAVISGQDSKFLTQIPQNFDYLVMQVLHQELQGEVDGNILGLIST